MDTGADTFAVIEAAGTGSAFHHPGHKEREEKNPHRCRVGSGQHRAIGL